MTTKKKGRKKYQLNVQRASTWKSSKILWSRLWIISWHRARISTTRASKNSWKSLQTWEMNYRRWRNITRLWEKNGGANLTIQSHNRRKATVSSVNFQLRQILKGASRYNAANCSIMDIALSPPCCAISNSGRGEKVQLRFCTIITRQECHAISARKMCPMKIPWKW